MSAATNPRKSIRFKGRSFMALVLAPEPPTKEWLAEIDAFAARSPGFFAGRPVVLEISAMPKDEEAVAAMVAELKKRDLRIVGIEGTDTSWLVGEGLPPILTGGRAASAFVELASKRSAEPVEPSAPKPMERAAKGAPAAPKAPEPAATPEPIAVLDQPASGPTSLLLDKPVRSGTAIYFPQGDVTVIGAIASGAEVVAGGSIHVYGALRGRAIAGCNGNPRAQIFCRKLDAELLAIDGYYKTADDMDSQYRGRAAQVRLDGDAIVMEALG